MADRDDARRGRAVFDRHALDYDTRFSIAIPDYSGSLDLLVDLLPFDDTESVSVLDLGCGTGALTYRVRRRFPASRVTGVDLSTQMLSVASTRLAGDQNVTLVHGDFTSHESHGGFDAVLSSFALHHAPTAELRRRGVDNAGFEGASDVYAEAYLEVYRYIVNALAPGGVFYTADLVLGATDRTRQLLIGHWREWLCRSFPDDDAEGFLAGSRREDRPAPLAWHMRWLRDAGLTDLDAISMVAGFAVFGGRRPRPGGTAVDGR